MIHLISNKMPFSFGSVKKMLTTSVFACLCAVGVNAQTYYGLFPSEEASDAMRVMKVKNENNFIQWTCDESVTVDTRICLRNSDSELNPVNQMYEELSNQVDIPCMTPNREFKLKKLTSFREMGLSLCDTIKKLNIWLTFKPSGAPDTLFVGKEPGPSHIFNFPKTRIFFHSDKLDKFGNFPKGAALSFEAEAPAYINSDLLEWEWYVDGVHMKGRTDRWFETYSRTKWKDGKHTISCRYRRKGGTRYSEMASVDIWQTITDEHSVKVYPYWGADCTDEENLDSTYLTYNECMKWGSFIIQPIEEYVHFYMEFLQEDIESATIHNSPAITNFELLREHDSGENYLFFDLPTNCKAHAKEPYSPVKVYFRIENKVLDYSLVPYINPTVSVSPERLEICENSFENASVMNLFNATDNGFPSGCKKSYRWYYSPTKDGEYVRVQHEHKNQLLPDKTGYYKLEVTDNVFSAWSDVLTVEQRTENCVSANITAKDGKDYSCVNGTTELHTSLISPGYTYQWKIGSIDGSNLVDIEGAKDNFFYATVNKPNEAYYIEVKYGNRAVLSKPFAVRQLAKLNPISNKKLVTEAYPTEVCMDYNVTLKARVTDRVKDSLPLVYNFYKSSILAPELIGTIESADENVYFSTPVSSTGSAYYVVAVGCDQSLRSSGGNMVVNLRNDDMCGQANFYVKKSGDDFNDGTSWANAFATVTHAVETAKELRKSMIYANTTIYIHVAAGLYTSDNELGFDFPSNTIVYGGYDELPVDRTISGTERNPKSPANPNGNATTFYSSSADKRIVQLVDREDVTLIGINFVGDKLTTTVDGRAMTINGSSVTLDSCWFSGFKSSPSSDYPIAAVSFMHDKDSKSSGMHNTLSVKNCSFTDNEGGNWGACLNILADGQVNIENSTFFHNQNNYKGGVALLSYVCSPKINITNSTFFDNRVVKEGGSYGSSVIRMVGGTPEMNVVCSTICDHFCKEDGTLKIYNSIVECAGNADVYQNNFPKESPFSEATRDNAYNARAFATNFKGSPFNKMQNTDALTQVLIPANKLQIIGQAGRPYPKCLFDQRGVKRNEIASSFGAYEQETCVAIETTEDPECFDKKTIANFRSAVSGVTDPKYQWVNNYSDIEGANSPELKNVSLGTYWLEVKGTDKHGKPVSLRSGEIRVSDNCENPGDFFVKAVGGNDSFSGTTWNKAFATLDQALMIAKQYREKNGLDKPVTIRLAAGTYKPTYQSGFRLDKMGKYLQNIVIEGGYPTDATRDDAIKPKCHEKTDGNETVLTMNSNKSRLFYLGYSVQGVKFKGLHFQGIPKLVSTGCAMAIDGASVEIDSCWFSGFTDGSVTQEGNNSCISIISTSNVKMKNCYISGNVARQGSGIAISGNDNKTVLNVYSSTFFNNQSKMNGGAALLVNGGANPTVRLMNVVMFSNRALSNDFSGCSVIRLAGKSADLKIYNSTIYGTMFNESGRIEAVNSLVEATSASLVNTNSFIADNGLKDKKSDMDLRKHRNFADGLSYTLSLETFIPVLRLKAENGNEEMLKQVPTIENVEGFDLGTDACDMPRGATCNMGACQVIE